MTVEPIWIMDHSISHQLEKVGIFNFKPLLLTKVKSFELCFQNVSALNLCKNFGEFKEALLPAVFDAIKA